MIFDRVVSDELLAALAETGAFHGLIERRSAAPQRLDLQLRRDQRGARSWASLYLGLTSILDLDERKGQFRLRAHPTHRAAGSFDPGWSAWQTADELAARWTEVDGYLDRMTGGDRVSPHLWNSEGRVHAALCSGGDPSFSVVQREAAPSFDSEAARDQRLQAIADQIWVGVAPGEISPPWWPGVRDRGVRPRMGPECDILAVDTAGRLLAVEAKPSNALKGLAWGPAQVRLYAELFAGLLDEVDKSGERISQMLSQRAHLGLSTELPLAAEPRVVPVLAVGHGPLSPQAGDRIEAIAAAIGPSMHPRVDPLEVWLLSEDGVVDSCWHPGVDERPPHFARPSSTRARRLGSSGGGSEAFRDEARQAATEWKRTSTVLPDSARGAGSYRGRGSYPFCLPPEDAVHDLLPGAREIGLDRFAAAGIPWHDGVGSGPSNHLLSSQVQCVNVLAPFVDDPAAVASVLSPVLPIAEVLPFGAKGSHSPHDATDHVVFEWVGLQDHLGERGGAPGTRGAKTTSADAAVRYRAEDGSTEVALIEWKYTERYSTALHGGAKSQAVRRARYVPLWEDPHGPIRTDRLTIDDLLVEPFYQLMRLQLLAWRMEATGELGADRVRVLYVAPGRNTALWGSLQTPVLEQIADGGGVLAAWRALLRQPDRFAWLDSAALVAPGAPTSAELKARYGHLAGLPSPASAARPGARPREE